MNVKTSCPYLLFTLQEFLDREKENNYEMDRKQKAAERLAAKIRLDCQTAETTRLQVKDELETLKYSVDRSAMDLESARSRSAQLSKDIKDKRKMCVQYFVLSHHISEVFLPSGSKHLPSKGS